MDKDLIIFSIAIYVRFRLQKNELLSKLLPGKKFYLNISEYFQICSFKEINIENIYALIWTTTPWSLIGNQAVAVNEKLKYLFIKLSSTDDIYIVAESLLDNIKKFPPFSDNQFEIIGNCLGKNNLLITQTNFSFIQDHNYLVLATHIQFIMMKNFIQF